MKGTIVNRWVASTLPAGVLSLWERFRASPLWVRLAKGVMWSVVGAVISRGLGVVSSIIVARLLGITAFGEFTIIQSTIGLFGVFAGLGLGVTATKYVAELRDADPERCGRILGLALLVATIGGVLIGILLVLFAPWFARETLAAPHLAPLLVTGAGLVLFSGLQGVYTGALGGFEAFKKSSQVQFWGAVLGTPFLVVGCLVAGLEGAVFGAVLQMAVGCVIGHLAISREAAAKGIRISYRVNREELAVLWGFSIPAFLSSILTTPANWICNTLLVNQEGGYEEIAILSAAGQWKNLLSFLPLVLTSVLLPMLSNLYREGKLPEMTRLLRRNLFLMVGACLLMALPLILLSNVVLGWYGAGFQNGTLVFVLSLAGTAIVAANNLLSRAVQAAGRAWLEFSFSAVWAVALVLSCMALIPSTKATGLAIGHIVAAALLAIWQWMTVRKLFAVPAHGAAVEPTHAKGLA
ncbi:MAG: oligosaccharide flippase family protein [Verrucomicrobiota bacterium]|nr:oligosaccharide flippase family protein [Verrucomicrobiota bacterium]